MGSGLYVGLIIDIFPRPSFFAYRKRQPSARLTFSWDTTESTPQPVTAVNDKSERAASTAEIDQLIDKQFKDENIFFGPFEKLKEKYCFNLIPADEIRKRTSQIKGIFDLDYFVDKDNKPARTIKWAKCVFAEEVDISFADKSGWFETPHYELAEIAPKGQLKEEYDTMITVTTTRKSGYVPREKELLPHLKSESPGSVITIGQFCIQELDVLNSKAGHETPSQWCRIDQQKLSYFANWCNEVYRNSERIPETPEEQIVHSSPQFDFVSSRLGEVISGAQKIISACDFHLNQPK